MVERDFEDIVVVAVASGKTLGREALSVDTIMGEMLPAATRKTVNDRNHSETKCVTIYEPVTRLDKAAEIAKGIRDTENGPVIVGNEVGVARIFETNKGAPWSYVGTIHDTVAVIASDLATGRLRDVAGENILDIPMTALGEMFEIGPTHHLIRYGGYTTGAFIRTMSPATRMPRACTAHCGRPMPRRRPKWRCC